MSKRDRQWVFGQILLAANRMQHRLDSQLPDLTLKQWLALIVVRNLPQPVESVAVLANVLGGTHQNTTKLVLALQRRGFVVLEPSPDDRRARRLTVAPAGHAYLAENEALGDRLLEAMFDGLADADVIACARVLEKVQGNLERLGATDGSEDQR